MSIRKILIVEDDTITAKTIECMVKEFGYEIHSIVKSGEEAIQAVKSSLPNLIIMDIYLEGKLDGIETADEINRNHPIPIIYLTGYSDEKTILRIKQQDPYSFLTKPVRKHELQVAINVAFYKFQKQLLLQNREEWLSAVLGSIAEGIISININGEITYMNQIAEKLTGFLFSESIGQNLHHVLNIFNETTGQAITFSFPDSLSSDSMYIFNAQWILKTKNEIDILIENQISSVKNSSGNVTDYVLVFRDISLRRQAEKALVKSEAYFSSLIENTKQAIWTVDNYLQLVTFNSVFEERCSKLFGVKPEVGYRISDLVTEKYSYWLDFHEKSLKGEQFSVEQTYIVDNRSYNYTLSFYPIVSDLGLSGVSVFMNDVTDFKEQERIVAHARDQAVAAVNAKSEFLATMSHEIRTPLNAIIGMTSLLLGTSLSSQQRDYVETLRHSGNLLRTLINDILDYSKIEAGKLEPERIEFNLQTTINNMVKLFEQQAKKKKLELESSMPTNVPSHLIGDPGRLRQILSNLISNAIKFTESGKVSINVSVHEKKDESINIKFEVIDTGIGILQEMKSRLFQLFTQADKSTTRKFGGTGLGLAICKQLVELLNGEIDCDSEPGRGSTFWFILPFNIVHQEKAILVSKLNHSFRSTHLIWFTQEKVDELENSFSEVINSSGLNLTYVSKFKELLGVLDEQFDRFFIILDLSPEEVESGFQLAQQIKSSKDAREVDIIMLVPYGQKGHGKLSREVGISAYLTKPLKPDLLYDCLKTLQLNETTTLITRHTLREAKEQKTTVLIVEDNEINQKIFDKQLEIIGCKTRVAVNGKEAVNFVTHQKLKFDMIFMDCQMPEMDGFEATQLIRQWELDTKQKHRLPIVALTAYAMAGDKEQCFEAGMDDYLSKPVEFKELQDIVIKWKQVRPEINQDQSLKSLVLDMKILSNLKSMSKDEPQFFIDILKQFIFDSELKVKEIYEAADENDKEKLKFLAHKLQSSCANIGALKMTEVCRNIQIEVSNESTESFLPFAIDLSQYFEEAKEILLLELEKLK